MSDASVMARETITLAGIELELHEGGSGPPLLFLHSAQGFAPDQPYVGLLARAPPPDRAVASGLRPSGLPLWLDTLDDIAHLYLELMDRRGLGRVDVVGSSLGGWIAAEIATKAPERFGKLALVGPVGVKLGPPDKLDIPDIFAMAQDKVARLLYHDVDKGKFDRRENDRRAADDASRATARPRRCSPGSRGCTIRSSAIACTASRRRRCSCAATATGWSARITSTAMPSSCPMRGSTTIAEAGHAPQLEQPEEFARVLFWLSGRRTRRREERDEGVAFQRDGLSLSAAGRGVRIDPRQPAEPHLRSEEGRRALRPLHRGVADRRGRRRRDHAQRASSDGDLRRSGGAAAAGGLGARHQKGAALDPRQSDRQPAPAGARRRGNGAGRRAVARPARGGLRARRALRDLRRQQQSGAHERALCEALDLIVKAWTSHDGPFSHEGRFFHHRQINIWPRPYQQPHPPVWVSTTTPAGAQRVGAQGFVQATFLTGYDGTRRVYDSYRRGWREAGRGDGRADRPARLCGAGLCRR